MKVAPDQLRTVLGIRQVDVTPTKGATVTDTTLA
jgi:hypothetical protein